MDVVVKIDNGIILSKRDIPPAKGKWHIPGGTVLRGETLKEAAMRVAKEELGLNVSIDNLLGVIEFSDQSGIGQPVSISFLAKVISGKLRGSYQAREVKVFETSPKNTISEHKKFLSETVRMK